jgi:hypothetical protein
MAFAVSVGCTWVGPQTKIEAEGNLDEDGDGCPRKLDCDDAQPKEGCTIKEIPYDGWDNDCDGADVVDVDGDNYPGITKEAWDALESRNEALEWPLGVLTAQVDCRDVRPDDVDLYNFEADSAPVTHVDALVIHPGAGESEEPYDGIDQDCDGSNDFDADGDGYLLPADTLLEAAEFATLSVAYEAYQAEWGYTFASPEFIDYGDCDDNDADANPGVATADDTWYDGTDQDCTANNDFDADGDGYMPDGYEADYASYLSRYFPDDDEPWTEQYGDCMDIANAQYVGLDPALVSPVGTDVAYDGIDNDCTGDNDFDSDGDGYRVEGLETEYEFYTTHWTYTSIPSSDEGDCDDGDAAVTPVSPEGFNDGVDQDCDGGDSTTPFGYSDMNWDYPREVVTGITTDHYVVTASADNVGLPTSSLPKVALSMLFEPSQAGHNAAWSTQPIFWQGVGTPAPLGDGVDMVISANVFYVSTSYYNNGSVLMIKRLEYDAVSKTYLQALAFRGVDVVDQTYDDLDLQQDSSGKLWAFACAESSIQFLVATGASGTFSREAEAELDNIDGGTDCFVDVSMTGKVLQGVACDGENGCIAYDLDSTNENITLADNQDWTDLQVHETDTHGDFLIAPYLDTGLLLYDLETNEGFDVLVDDIVVNADYELVGKTHYLTAVLEDVAGDRSLWLYWGKDLDDSLESIELPVYRDNAGVPSFDLVLVDTSISVDSDRIMVGMVAEDENADPDQDAVGWIFLER